MVVPILERSAVEQVPILSPIRMGIAASIGSRPAEPRAINRPIVAELLWRSTVSPKPASIP